MPPPMRPRAARPTLPLRAPDLFSPHPLMGILGSSALYSCRSDECGVWALWWVSMAPLSARLAETLPTVCESCVFALDFDYF